MSPVLSYCSNHPALLVKNSLSRAVKILVTGARGPRPGRMSRWPHSLAWWALARTRQAGLQ